MTTMTSASSSVGKRSSSQVRPVWTNTASKLGVPDLEDLFSIEINDYTCPETGRVEREVEDYTLFNYCDYDEWLACGHLSDADQKSYHQSLIDNQPRVVNLNGLDPEHEPMIRVGDWSGLAQPREHQVRHVHLAKIRRADPSRVCSVCSYYLGHKCNIFPSTTIHCKECCIIMQQSSKEKDVKKGGGKKTCKTRR